MRACGGEGGWLQRVHEHWLTLRQTLLLAQWILEKMALGMLGMDSTGQIICLMCYSQDSFRIYDKKLLLYRLPTTALNMCTRRWYPDRITWITSVQRLPCQGSSSTDFLDASKQCSWGGGWLECYGLIGHDNDVHQASDRWLDSEHEASHAISSGQMNSWSEDQMATVD